MSETQSISPAQAQDFAAEIARLRAENESLKAKKAHGVTLKVSSKGAVSMYGLGRWPVTLYASQWEQVLSKADAIREFIAANESALSVKEDKQA